MICFPSTRWEFRTQFVSLSLDGQGQLLRADPHRVLAIFFNNNAIPATIFPGIQPEILATTPFELSPFDTLLIPVFDYADLVGQAWFGVSPALGEIVTTELSPASTSPQVKYAPPKKNMLTDFRRPEQFVNVDTTTLFSRNTQRIALLVRTFGGACVFGVSPEISSSTGIIRVEAFSTRTLLIADYGPLIWEAWWGIEVGGSGQAPEFWEIIQIPEPIDCLTGVP